MLPLLIAGVAVYFIFFKSRTASSVTGTMQPKPVETSYTGGSMGMFSSQKIQATSSKSSPASGTGGTQTNVYTSGEHVPTIGQVFNGIPMVDGGAFIDFTTYKLISKGNGRLLRLPKDIKLPKGSIVMPLGPLTNISSVPNYMVLAPAKNSPLGFFAAMDNPYYDKYKEF